MAQPDSTPGGRDEAGTAPAQPPRSDSGGSRSATDSQDDQFERNAALARKRLAALIFLLGLPTFTLSGVIWKLIDDTGLLTIWQQIWLTLPLTLAVALLTFCWLTKVRLSYGAVVAIVVLSFVIVTALGWHSDVRFGDIVSGGYTCTQRAPGVPVHFGGVDYATPGLCVASTYHAALPWYEWPVGLAGEYLRVFGARGFLSALAVGAFLGTGAPFYLASAAFRRSVRLLRQLRTTG